MIQMKPDKEAFDRVVKELEQLIPLNCQHVVDVFGWPAVELYLLISGNESPKVISLLKDIRRKLNQ